MPLVDCEVPESSKTSVFLKMSKLIRKSFNDINGPDLKIFTSVGPNGVRTVSVSFDATQMPFQIKDGVPEKKATFVGTNGYSVQDAEINAVSKVCAYLSSKFCIRFADWNYEKLLIAERKISEVEINIKYHVSTITDMLKKWKACVELLLSTQLALSSGANPLQTGVCRELITLQSDVQSTILHLSSRMESLTAHHVLSYSDHLNSNTLQDATIIKISERDIIDDILCSLGFKNAKFTNTVEDNFLFRGSCKINMNSTSSSRRTGKTIVKGDPQKSAYEAECSAAAKAILFLETIVGIKVVDLSFFGLIEKEDQLKLLIDLKARYEEIQHEVQVEWKSMIAETKAVLNFQYELCKQKHIVIDDNLITETTQIMEETVADLTLLYDLCTVDLDPASAQCDVLL